MNTALFQFDSTYASLPERFWRVVRPTPVAQPQLLCVNTELAQALGLDLSALTSADGLAVLAGNQLPDDAASIALAYAGHQFGQFVPQLGDGRAILLGEVLDPSGRRFDIQLKGAGPTPFSRRGDGRAAIGPVLREYLVSEAMHTLGIPTTRALAAVATGEMLWRETPLPGAILTRVASSHIRVGTFQFFAARGDHQALQLLLEHVITRHYPEIELGTGAALALLQAVAQRQARLIAQWMQVGFIHGVMNTDNSSICGETLDYGPCAFMDAYHPQQVFSAIDRGGRYAYANQALIGQWNLARLAESLLPLIHDDADHAIAQAEAVIEQFPAQYEKQWLSGMRRKLGLLDEQPSDHALLQSWLDALAHSAVDYTLAFRGLSESVKNPEALTQTRALFAVPEQFDDWWRRWIERCQSESSSTDKRCALMCASNPAVIPRNHQVQAVLLAAQDGDMAPFHALLEVLRRPFEHNAAAQPYMAAPAASERVIQTFCGT